MGGLRALRIASAVSLVGVPARAQERTPTNDDPPEATVRARARAREVHRRELSAAEMQRMPGTRGDALLAVQNLPGVGRPAFGLGAFILRASDPEDSLVTLESQPFGLPFHFYGLATTLATDLIERIEVLPGNFSARWGRAAGGVVNVTLRSPARDRVHVTADVDLVDAGAYASVPIGRRSALAVGVRRSYVDAWLGLADLGGSFSRLPRYWDYQAVYDADPTAADNVRVIVSGSDDALGFSLDAPDANDPNLRGSSGSAVSFHGAQARWRHRWGAGAQHSLSLAASTQDADVTAGSTIRYLTSTRQLSLRDELELRLGRHARLFAGIDAVLGETDATLAAPPLSPSGITDPTGATGLARYQGTRGFFNPAAHAEVELDDDRRWRALLGVRVDHFSRSDRFTVDPRVSGLFRAHPRIGLRGAIGSYSTLPRGYAVIPGFGNPDLGPERWWHGAAGLQIDVIPGALELTADVFAKWGDATAAPSSRTIVRDGQEVPERFASTGSARVLGGEWWLRLRPGRLPLYGWLSYTYQRAERRDAAGLAWHPSTWDQPHLLSFILGVALPRGWEVGARVRWASGLPEPVVTGALVDSDHDVALTWVDSQRTGRLPDTWQLDLRAAKRFRWGPLRMQFIAEVLNTTNQANAESRLYAWDRRRSAYITGLPILPSVGLRAEY